ncbi:ethanolamine ammonia-lyase reactivating factor EutA, partial [Escherichia coli]|uniref:ethanolamine ammonia-lyase reactivating factor EutA n=1 Tax=Escherichia coli TaxID=562 RepID=UPI00215D9B8B
GTVCVVGKMRDLILQLSKSSIYSTKPQLPLAVIDEVIVRAGDYIDIGTPLFGGSVVPVTVKSLAFPS